MAHRLRGWRTDTLNVVPCETWYRKRRSLGRDCEGGFTLTWRNSFTERGRTNSFRSPYQPTSTVRLRPEPVPPGTEQKEEDRYQDDGNVGPVMTSNRWTCPTRGLSGQSLPSGQIYLLSRYDPSLPWVPLYLSSCRTDEVPSHTNVTRSLCVLQIHGIISPSTLKERQRPVLEPLVGRETQWRPSLLRGS